MMLATLLFSGLMAHAAPDMDSSYNDCVKAARGDDESAKCLDTALTKADQALSDVVGALTSQLNGDADLKPKAKLLGEAHAKWLPSRDADCKLQGAVTTDSAEDAADAAKLCVYQANIPRLKQYQRFLGFLRQ